MVNHKVTDRLIISKIQQVELTCVQARSQGGPGALPPENFFTLKDKKLPLP